MKYIKLFESFIFEAECQQYSEQEMASMSKIVEDGLIESGIEEEDFKNIPDTTPEMKSKIQELKELHNSIKKDITASDFKALIKEIKKIKKEAQSGVKESLNEQNETLADFFKPVLDWFNKLPKEILIGIAIWYLLRICRCFIYKLESRLFSCGLSWKRSVLGRVTQFILLDLRTLRDPDDSTFFCSPLVRAGEERYEIY